MTATFAMETAVERCEFFSKLGFSIIPVPHKSKIAVIKWKQYQTSRATGEEHHTWFGNGHGPLNMAILTGSMSASLSLIRMTPRPKHGQSKT